MIHIRVLGEPGNEASSEHQALFTQSCELRGFGNVMNTNLYSEIWRRLISYFQSLKPTEIGIHGLVVV